jgi:hypothetical protein
MSTVRSGGQNRSGNTELAAEVAREVRLVEKAEIDRGSHLIAPSAISCQRLCGFCPIAADANALRSARMKALIATTRPRSCTLNHFNQPEPSAHIKLYDHRRKQNEK